MKSRTYFFPTHCTVLRIEGFKRESMWRRANPAETIAIYERTEGDRKLSVQLWGDGKHRVSHMLNGRGITTPTSFQTVEQMRAAINRERTREHRSDVS